MSGIKRHLEDRASQIGAEIREVCDFLNESTAWDIGHAIAFGACRKYTKKADIYDSLVGYDSKPLGPLYPFFLWLGVYELIWFVDGIPPQVKMKVARCASRKTFEILWNFRSAINYSAIILKEDDDI